MGLGLLRKLESEHNPGGLAIDAPIRPEARLALSREAIEQAVIDLRTIWGLSRSETCILLQAALGESDRIIAFRLDCTRSTVRKNWESIREKSGYQHYRRTVFDVWQRALL
jgi:DNA-binding NarL/FixJ family response regulator